MSLPFRARVREGLQPDVVVSLIEEDCFAPTSAQKGKSIAARKDISLCNF